MKKILYMMLALSTMALVSCEKEDIGGTATEEMAGQWYVSVSAIDDQGNIVYEDEDLFGIGEWLSLTFNTNKNVPEEMYVSDLGNFWAYQVKVKCDPSSKTFATDGWQPNEGGDEINVRVTDGKIVYGGALTPSGQPADAIQYCVEFDDDPYPAAYGYSKYLVKGYRYTGMAADD